MLTSEGLIELAARDWSDEGLDRRVADGLSSAQHVANVKAEMPSPRAVEVAPADIIIHDEVEIELGGVTVRVRHIGGDHSADSCVIWVEPDRVLFMGDCLSASPAGVMTSESASRLQDGILGSHAEHYIEGHHESVSSPREMETLFEKMELAERTARGGLTIEAADEDTEYFIDAFRAGSPQRRKAAASRSLVTPRWVARASSRLIGAGKPSGCCPGSVCERHSVHRRPEAASSTLRP